MPQALTVYDILATINDSESTTDEVEDAHTSRRRVADRREQKKSSSSLRQRLLHDSVEANAVHDSLLALCIHNAPWTTMLPLVEYCCRKHDTATLNMVKAFGNRHVEQCVHKVQNAVTRMH
jgi:hypothetical protein